MEELKAGDRDLWEAYGHLDRRTINKAVDVVRSIIEEAERYAGNRKSVRAPRKPRTKSAAQVVKGLTDRYQKECRDLKLVSIDPTLIVGARVLWLYNVKYKKLTRLVSDKAAGFTVSGSTVKGYDENVSTARSLRKPELVLKQVLEARRTDAAEAKIMAALTTKAQEANGRINPDTIILRAWK
jgi:hypothetical protein